MKTGAAWWCGPCLIGECGMSRGLREGLLELSLGVDVVGNVRTIAG